MLDWANIMYGWNPEMTAQLLAAYEDRNSTVAAKEAKEKAEQEEADAKKTPDEQLREALRNCEIAGLRFCGRIVGVLDRETLKLIDQFSILEKHRKEVTKIVTQTFLNELDKVMVERGFLEPHE